MTLDFPLYASTFFPPFVKCLQSLPHLRTLEMGWVDALVTAPLKSALKGVKLPQIRTLILPPAAYPLLRHCRDVEDVVCVVRCQTTFPDGLLRSLASNRNSKVKRLAIPLVMWPNPSRKRFCTLWDHDIVMATDCLRPQDLWPRVRNSPN